MSAFWNRSLRCNRSYSPLRFLRGLGCFRASSHLKGPVDILEVRVAGRTLVPGLSCLGWDIFPQVVSSRILSSGKRRGTHGRARVCVCVCGGVGKRVVGLDRGIAISAIVLFGLSLCAFASCSLQIATVLNFRVLINSQQAMLCSPPTQMKVLPKGLGP